MALTKDDIKQLAEDLGPKITQELDTSFKKFETELNEKYKLVKEGLIEKTEFENFKTAGLAEINQKLAALEEVNKKQGEKINELIAKGEKPTKGKSIDDVIAENMEKIQQYKKQGMGNFPIDLKAAGVVSIGNIADMDAPPDSPYAPGIDATQLQFYDITQNTNFALNRVDMGRATQYRIAWINEIGGEGLPTEVAEGQPKPLMDVDFKVEMSTAVKLAGMVTITEEFEKSVPYLAQLVRRLIREKMLRGFDNAVYAALIAAATGYTITGLDDKIQAANLWDALLAGLTQVSVNNYTANLIGLNAITNTEIQTQKDGEDRYLLPPFAPRINSLIAESNKVAVDYALVGDATQYKVDIFEDLTLKVGYNMDDLNRNQFSIVAEIWYHRYISDNRKKALVYYNLATVRDQVAEAA